MNYYNDIDPYVCAWLENLERTGNVPRGHVDCRSVADIAPASLIGRTHCHFFAGIGGWPLALSLAGWPDDRPVWTGSCPCQPFSSATRGRRTAPDLWPYWRVHIAFGRPPTIFGEQVATAKRWFDGVCDDLEALGYTIGTSVLPACSVGQDHVRERIFFVGHANGQSQPIRTFYDEVARVPRDRSDAGEVARTDGVSPRVAQLRAYGNAIVPQVAAEFIGAYMETLA